MTFGRGVSGNVLIYCSIMLSRVKLTNAHTVRGRPTLKKYVHISKHCREMTLLLLWIGTYCISCVVQQTSGVKDLSSLVRYDDSSLAAIRHVQSIIPIVRPRPNIRSHSVLFTI